MDGEGGFTVWGKLYPAEVAKRINGLTIGLANNVKLKNDIEKDQPVCWSDVQPDLGCPVVQIREKIYLGQIKDYLCSNIEVLLSILKFC